MPKLLLLAACEKAIVEQQTNAVSMISLLQDVYVQLTPGATPPREAIIPMAWAVVSIFQRQPDDGGKSFEHQTIVANSAGRALLQTAISLFDLRAEFHRIVNHINGMPIGFAGPLAIKCCLREKGAPDWREIAAYPININWQPLVSPTA
jgi:hypothetical protein